MQGNDRDTEKVNMRFTMVLWLTLCVSSMAVMLWFSANKTVVIADAAVEKQEEVPLQVMGRDLMLTALEDEERCFSLPLPQDVKAGNIVMENHYAEKELWLHIKSVSESFFDKCSVMGDVSAIQSGRCWKQENGILLKLKMTQIFEYKSTMEGNALVIVYDNPGEVFERTIVLDPAGGGSDTGYVAETSELLYEKDVALDVAKQVQKKLSLEGVKVYLTRTDDSEVAVEQRLEMARAVEADMYIRIGVSLDAESAENYGIGCVYNENYYLPDFGNVQLSDMVVKEVTIASGNRALGLMPASDDSILQELTIPATSLSVGYFSNEQESELLSRESYREKLAEGIAAAIKNACERLTEIEDSRMIESKLHKKGK